ncbi:MAG: hypothetical protein C0599_16265 [Salinivirgaceae bacterium]|nr:MAG: hypothetical protein C0599_16265 [Salinivirgaceae bacterium]
MKNLLLIFSMLFMLSCCTDATKKDEAKADDQKANTEQTDDASKSDCDEFLDDYEKWVDEVIVVYKKVQEDPTDMENTQKLLTVTTEVSKWAEKWESLMDCANNEEYAKRMEELEERVNKAMSE